MEHILYARRTYTQSHTVALTPERKRIAHANIYFNVRNIGNLVLSLESTQLS